MIDFLGNRMAVPWLPEGVISESRQGQGLFVPVTCESTCWVLKHVGPHKLELWKVRAMSHNVKRSSKYWSTLTLLCRKKKIEANRRWCTFNCGSHPLIGFENYLVTGKSTWRQKYRPGGGSALLSNSSPSRPGPDKLLFPAICLVSPARKTRLSLDCLCQNWGLYIPCAGPQVQLLSAVGTIFCATDEGASEWEGTSFGEGYRDLATLHISCR